MTSKQAKKAYAKQQNGSRVNKTEQRRREQEELDRIRKEWEKEKAAKKALLVREKKAAKLAAEKEERRKKGLPEPSRFVRASQPNISMFARAGGKGDGKRVWQQIESGVETHGEISALEEDHMDEAEPPAKRVALDEDYRMSSGGSDRVVSPTKDGATGLSREADGNAMQHKLHSSPKKDATKPGARTTASDPVEPSDERTQCKMEQRAVPEVLITKARAIDDSESEEDFGDFPSMTQVNILEKIASSFGSTVFPASSKMKVLVDQNPKPPARPQPIAMDKEDSFDDAFLEMVSTQLLIETADEASRRIVGTKFDDAVPMSKSPKTDTGAVRSRSNTTTESNDQERAAPIAATRQPIIDMADRPSDIKTPFIRPPMPSTALQERSNNMTPPKLPARSLLKTTFATPALRKLHNLNADRPASISSPRTAPPRFLPQGRNITPIPPPPPKPRLLPDKGRGYSKLFSPPRSGTQAFLDNHFDDFFPSPTQEVRELMEDAFSLPSNTQVARELGPPPKPIRFDLKKEFDTFVSTQDLMMSSQDMQELDSTPIFVEAKAVPPPRPASPIMKEKRRFFQEKQEDLKRAGLLKEEEERVRIQQDLGLVAPESFLEDEEAILAVIRESERLEAERLAAVTGPTPQELLLAAIEASEEQQRREAEARVPCSPSPERLEAAIRESERLAAIEEQRRINANQGPRRFFAEKEEDVLQAALHESKMVDARQKQAAVQKKAIVAATEQRTLTRSVSNTSDYSDENSFSSQELLALF